MKIVILSPFSKSFTEKVKGKGGRGWKEEGGERRVERGGWREGGGERGVERGGRERGGEREREGERVQKPNTLCSNAFQVSLLCSHTSPMLLKTTTTTIIIIIIIIIKNYASIIALSQELKVHL